MYEPHSPLNPLHLDNSASSQENELENASQRDKALSGDDERPNVENPLVSEFLAHLNAVPESCDAQKNAEEKTVDLYSLFSELTVMKSELKHASRHMKAGLEDFRSVFLTLQKSHDALALEVNHRKDWEVDKIMAETSAAIKPYLIQLIDLHERIGIGIRSLASFKPNIIVRLFSRKVNRFLRSQIDGQQLLLTRVEQQLARENVIPIQALNEPFNAAYMCTIGTACCPNKDNGVVLEEIKKGYRWNDAVLRNSEVIVNKWEK